MNLKGKIQCSFQNIQFPMLLVLCYARVFSRLNISRKISTQVFRSNMNSEKGDVRCHCQCYLLLSVGTLSSEKANLFSLRLGGWLNIEKKYQRCFIIPDKSIGSHSYSLILWFKKAFFYVGINTRPDPLSGIPNQANAFFGRIVLLRSKHCNYLVWINKTRSHLCGDLFIFSPEMILWRVQF